MSKYEKTFKRLVEVQPSIFNEMLTQYK